MGQLTDELVRTLEAGGPEARRALLAASELLRKAWHTGFTPIFEDLAAEEVTSQDAAALRRALQHFCEREASPPFRRVGLTALAKQGDAYLLADLTKELHIVLEAHSALSNDLFQLLLALEDIGERVYPQEERSRSFDSVQRNLQVAREYLKQQGLLVPY